MTITPAWTTPVRDFNPGDGLPSVQLDEHSAALAFLHDRGADLASATTITPVTEFHKVTGTTTIDNIAGLVDGSAVYLWFQSALTVRNNGGGIGNVRTVDGADLAVTADTVVAFRSDGSVVKQLGGAQAFARKGDSVLLAPAFSIDFQNITGGAHLEIIAYARSDRAADQDDLLLRFNNDAGTNYDHQRLRAESTVVDAVGTTGASGIVAANTLPGASSVANSYGVIDSIVPYYATPDNHKQLVARAGARRNTTAADLTVEVISGTWKSVAAINRVTLFSVNSANLVDGCRVSLYTF